MNIGNLWSQTSCNNAYMLNSALDTTYASNDTLLWVQFTPSTNSTNITTNNSNNSNSIIGLRLYSGNCSSLTEISNSNTNTISASTLDTTAIYLSKNRNAINRQRQYRCGTIAMP